MIKDFELYHGAVLMRILRTKGGSIKLIEKGPEHSWGEYEISDNRYSYKLFIKSTSTKSQTKNTCRANFTFSYDDIKRLKEVCDSHVIICLVCGKEGICTLIRDDVNEFDLLKSEEQCGISVSWKKGTSFSVKCKRKALSHGIARNRLETFEWS